MFLSSRTYGPLQAADGPDVAQEPQVVHPCFEVTSASKGQQRRYCSCWVHVFFIFMDVVMEAEMKMVGSKVEEG